MKEITLKVPDITCGGCADSIKNALGKMTGVSNVDVDVTEKKVTVEHDEAVSTADITEALDRAGFSAA